MQKSKITIITFSTKQAKNQEINALIISLHLTKLQENNNTFKLFSRLSPVEFISEED